MDKSLSNAADWAVTHFGTADLGDQRRNQRLIRLAAALAHSPNGSMPRSLPNSAELKAAYRLFQSPHATFASIMSPHWDLTRQDCAGAGEYLIVEDTTQMDFTSHAYLEGMGRIGNDTTMGFHLHSTLALRIEGWEPEAGPDVTVVGLLGQQCWTRKDKPKRKRESQEQRLSRDRESQRWAKTFDDIGPLPATVQWTYMADRESDIYEVFERCASKGVGWIIRACWPRSLEGEGVSVFDAVAKTPPLGRYLIELRARPGTPARSATMEVRATPVTLRGPRRPEGRPDPLSMNVVEAREVNPPTDVKPLCWVLLTTWPCADLSRARRVIQAYERRWLIEEYHKALKSGTKVEESQLATAAKITALQGILGVVAVRLLNAKLIARTHPDQKIDSDTMDETSRKILDARFGRPNEGWTNRSYLVAIARLGGFLARKGDGDPGWITIWRGWWRLTVMGEGFELAREP